jgi:hypothetical protein
MSSEHIVGAVAERAIIRALATAQIERAGLLYYEAVRLERSALV